MPGELLPQRRGVRIDDVCLGDVDPERRSARTDVFGSAENRELDDATPQQDLGGAQDAVVVSFGEHDVLALGLGALDELVLEHDRRHSPRPLDREALLELSRVHRRLEDAECGCYKTLVLGPDVRAHRVHRRRGDVCRLRDLEHGERRFLQKAGCGLAERHLAGENDAGHGRDRGRERRRDASHENVRAVGGNDDERPVDELVEEVLDAHRAHADVAHFSMERLARIEEDLRVEVGGHVGHGRVRELGAFRQHVDGLVDPELDELTRHLVGVLRRDAVHEHAEDLAALVLERRPCGFHRGDGLLG